MEDYRQWALEQLGLAGPGLAAQLDRWKQEKDPTSELVKAVRRRGRQLLGVYHPDKHQDSEEALRRFKAINEVLQTLDDMPLPRPEHETPEPRVRTSVSFYPERSPYGGTMETKTVQKSYFDFQTETTTTKLRYDARRVVKVRPK